MHIVPIEFSVTEGTEEKSCLLMSCLVSLPREPVVDSGSADGFYSPGRKEELSCIEK